MPWYCPACSGRTVWCYWCKVRHCTCKPHQPTRPGKSYIRKNHTIRKRDGRTWFMSARRYAHLKGAQKGGRARAISPHRYVFNSETARKASLARWQGRHRMNQRVGLRLGLPAKRSRPKVSRLHLRYMYARMPRLGIRYSPETVFDRAYWHTIDPFRIISETTALRRLGHLRYTARKNWVPEADEVIIATQVGIDPAKRKDRRKSS